MAKPQPAFDADELVRSIEEAMRLRDQPAGLTLGEICDQMKRSRPYVARLLKKLKAQGQLVADRAMREGIDGRQLPVPVYRIKKK